MKVHILVGTMTGNAQLCAEEISHALSATGVSVQIDDLYDVDCSVFDASTVFLICTSTYGQGDVPDNAKRFYGELCESRPDLSHVRYGVFGLGDRTYVQTFNNGGKRFDAILSELSAQRIGERFTHDASSDELPEEMAAQWAIEWIQLARERSASTV